VVGVHEAGLNPFARLLPIGRHGHVVVGLERHVKAERFLREKRAHHESGDAEGDDGLTGNHESASWSKDTKNGRRARFQLIPRGVRLLVVFYSARTIADKTGIKQRMSNRDGYDERIASRYSLEDRGAVRCGSPFEHGYYLLHGEAIKDLGSGHSEHEYLKALI